MTPVEQIEAIIDEFSIYPLPGTKFPIECLKARVRKAVMDTTVPRCVYNQTSRKMWLLADEVAELKAQIADVETQIDNWYSDAKEGR